MSLKSILHSLFTRLFLRRTNPDNLLKPVVIEGLLADIEGGETNLLPYSATQTPLKVAFEKWAHSTEDPEDIDKVTLHWDGHDFGPKDYPGPIDEKNLFIMVPTSLLNEDGPHTLTYTVVNYANNSSTSEPLTITTDTTPPKLPTDSRLQVAGEVVGEDGVTDAYLWANGDALPATIPPYADIRPGDVLTWYWSTTPTGTEQVDTWTLKLSDTTQPLQIKFPGAFIRNLGDGLRYLYYTVQDRAKTPIQTSAVLPLQCNATPLPTTFSSPYVKETGSTGGDSSTLDPVRAVNGATVVIEAVNRFDPNDDVMVHWGRPGEHGAYSAPVSIASGDIVCPIPKANVAARMGSDLELYFVVTRRDMPYESAVHSLKIDVPSTLEAPQCDKITGKVLKLSNIGTGATFTLERWPLMDTSQFVRLHISGERQDGNQDPVVVADAIPVPSPVAMTVGKVTLTDMGVFVVPTALKIEAFFSVDDKKNWIPFPLVEVMLEK